MMDRMHPDSDGVNGPGWRLTFTPVQRAKTPPCAAGCPTGTDIRGWLALIAQREALGLSLDDAMAEAWTRIVEVNPFPAVLGRICPHPCEGGCNRGSTDESVAINALERFVGDWGIARGLRLPRLDHERRKQSAGVIGAGPSGLSFAYQMARRGYGVTVYDGHERAGGMLRYGIPPYRLPPSVLDAEIARIRELGVEMRPGVHIGSEVTLDVLRSRHDVIYVAVGAQRGRTLGIPGESGPGVVGAIAYLHAASVGKPPDLGRRIAVVGGGNAAIDAARTARRTGAEVTLLYRRTRAEMPAAAEEVEAALGEGVLMRFLQAPVRVVRDGGTVVGLRLHRMTPGPVEPDGRRRAVPVPGAEVEEPCDGLIVAVSQQQDLSLFGDGATALAPDDSGRLAHDLWIGGDAVHAGIAGQAIARGRMAAEAAHRSLSGEREESEATAAEVARGVPADRGRRHPRPDRPRLALEQALIDGRREVHAGLSLEEFLTEVACCLSCGLCSGCGNCAMYCTSDGFLPLEAPGPGAYYALDLNRCQACGKCVDVCPCGYLEYA